MLNKTIIGLSLITTLWSCGESNSAPTAKPETPIISSVGENDYEEQDVSTLSIPSNCETFILDILSKHNLVQREGLIFDQVTQNSKTCQVKIRTAKVMEGELGIAIYVETDSKLLERQRILFEASKKSKLMFSETRYIDDLGDLAFYGRSDDFHTRSIRVLSGNATITVTDKAVLANAKYLSTETEILKLVKAMLKGLK